MTREEREIIEAIESMGYDRTAYPREKVSAVISMAIEALEDRPKGEWILSELQDEDEIRNDNYLYECSNCKHMDLHAKGQEVPYCWYCGADMRGGTND